MDERRLESRLAALERAVTDGESAPELADAAAATTDAATREERLADLEERVAELEAATRALRGYVGNVRSVNQSVEERADAAVARVAAVEERLDRTAGDSTGASRRPDSTESDPGAPGEPSAAAEFAGADGDLATASDPVEPDWLADADDRLPDDGVEPSTGGTDTGDGPSDDDADDGVLRRRLGELL